jgi:glycosyltransferase involved in cell wall biosynthesis
MSGKRRILIAHPYLHASGGGNLVAAWAIQALREVYDVSLATLGPVDVEGLNRNFGTALRADDFRVLIAPEWYRRMLKRVPTRGAFMQICLTMRFAQDLDNRHRYDLLFSTQNEVDFHRRGLQYVHFPSAYWPRPDYDMQWFHRVPLVLAAYNKFCKMLGRGSNEGLRRNVFMANSEFTARKIHEVHGAESTIVYPPVPGEFAATPWEGRAMDFIACGRIHHCKRWEMAVEILEEVRRRGFEVKLTLVGHRDAECPEYFERMEGLARSRPWFRMRCDLSREQLTAELGRHGYAIHTMEEEHFGISVAEARRAGCICFVHNSGGPVEIVEGNRQLTFDGPAEAVEKICQVLSGSVARDGLYDARERFTPERFCVALRSVAAQYFEGAAAEQGPGGQPAGGYG